MVGDFSVNSRDPNVVDANTENGFYGAISPLKLVFSFSWDA